MVISDKYTQKDLLPLVREYIERYNDVLDDIDTNFLENYCSSGKYFEIVPYLLTQFYVEFNIINKDNNVYLGILRKMKEAFELKKKNILEVGGGPIPSLGRMISKETEKLVTVIDPNITIKNNNNKNLNIVRKMFLPYTDISNYDLVVAFMACGTSEMILHNCAENNKDFFIGICPCGKDGINKLLDTNLSNKEYIDGVLELAEKKVKEYNMGKLIIDKLDDKYSYPFPIIYNKRPKMMTYEKR